MRATQYARYKEAKGDLAQTVCFFSDQLNLYPLTNQKLKKRRKSKDIELAVIEQDRKDWKMGLIGYWIRYLYFDTTKKMMTMMVKMMMMKMVRMMGMMGMFRLAWAAFEWAFLTRSLTPIPSQPRQYPLYGAHSSIYHKTHTIKIKQFVIWPWFAFWKKAIASSIDPHIVQLRAK